MLTSCTLSQFLESLAMMACPDSWYAVMRLSRSVTTRLFLAGPAMTLFIASEMSSIVMSLRFARAARIAASLSRFSMSAPVKPEVSLARLLKLTVGASGLLRLCTLKISSLPFTSGMLTYICLSNLPGRISAGSRMSARFVAAITMMLSLDSKPSIWTSSWLSVCSRSSLPPPSPAPR